MPHASPAPPDAPEKLQAGAGNPEQERGPTASPYLVLPPLLPVLQSWPVPGSHQAQLHPRGMKVPGSAKTLQGGRAKINSSPYTNAPPARHVLLLLLQNKNPFWAGEGFQMSLRAT